MQISSFPNTPKGRRSLCSPTQEQSPKLLALPDVRQSTDYSCGAAAMLAVTSFYGSTYTESELMEAMGTSPDHGTPPGKMVRFARQAGFQAEIRENLTLEDLEKAVQDHVPVTVAIQAWREGSSKDIPWKDTWDAGHYVVVMGLDQNHVYIEDPQLLGSRGIIPRAEFEERWHDAESTGREYHGLGIFVTKDGGPNPPPEWVLIE